MLDVAVVGLGWWGKIIAQLVATSDKLALVRVVDVDRAVAQAVGAQHGITASASFEEALRDPAVRGVVLCTPHTLHCEQIIAAARAGKHVFCEKPLSMSREEVVRASRAIDEAGVVLAVGHEMRFAPPIEKLLSIVRSGEIGTPLQVEANFSQDKFLTLSSDNWRLSSKEAPAGPMTATGIHLLDLSVAVFGEAEWVRASVKQLGSHLANGDTLAILIGFRNGGHALISAILATPFYGRFAVFGSHGWAEVRDKAHPESPQGWTLSACKRGGEPVTTEFAVTAPVLRNLEAFADACEGRAAYPVPRSEMIANIATLEACFKSAVSNRIEQVVNG